MKNYNKMIGKLNTIENIISVGLELEKLEKKDLILLKRQVEILRQYFVFKNKDFDFMEEKNIIF